MSVRRGASAPQPLVGRRSLRLDEVLRAGQAHAIAVATGMPGSERNSSMFGGGGGSGQSQDTARGGTRASSFSFGRARVHPVPAFPRAPQPPRPTNVAKLRAELAALQKTVAERDEVTFEQAQRIFALREQLEGARASLSEQAAEQEAYRAALEVAQRELEEQLVQVQTGLEAALAALEEERRAGRISAEEAARMAATLRSEAESMRTERDAAQQLLKGFVAEAAAARKELRAREAELNDLRQNNEMLARQLAASREDNEELQRAFDVERHRLLTTHDKLQSQLASRVQELSGCERRCKDSEAKLAAEKARGDALQEREFELMGELADRDSELARKDAEIQALKKALQDCEEEMKTTNDRSAAHLKLIEEWKAKYQKAQDDLDEAKAEFDEAKAVAAMKQADYEKRLAGAMKKLNDCKKKLADAERRLQGAIEAGRKCEAGERAKDEKISALLARLGQVRAEVSKHQDAERAAKAALKASQDDSKKLKDDLSRSEARRGALETQAVADAATLAEADKDIADCKRKLEECERKLEECERKLEECEEELEECERKLEECEEELPNVVANGGDLKETMRLLVKAALELSGPSMDDRGIGPEVNRHQPIAMVESIVEAMLDILANGSEGQKVALSKELAQNDFFFATTWTRPVKSSKHAFAQRPNYINWNQALPIMYWRTLQNFLGSTDATDRLAYLDLANMSPGGGNDWISQNKPRDVTSLELQSEVLQQIVDGKAIATMEELVFVWNRAKDLERTPFYEKKHPQPAEEVKAVDAQRQILADALPLVNAVLTRYNASNEAPEEETRSFYDMRNDGNVEWTDWPRRDFKNRSFNTRTRRDVCLMLLNTATRGRNASLVEALSGFGLKPLLDVEMNDKKAPVKSILARMLLARNFDANELVEWLKSSLDTTRSRALDVLYSIMPEGRDRGTPPWDNYQTKFAAAGGISPLLSVLREDDPPSGQDHTHALVVLKLLKPLDVAEAGAVPVLIDVFRRVTVYDTSVKGSATDLVDNIKGAGDKRFADEIDAKLYKSRDEDGRYDYSFRGR